MNVHEHERDQPLGGRFGRCSVALKKTGRRESAWTSTSEERGTRLGLTWRMLLRWMRGKDKVSQYSGPVFLENSSGLFEEKATAPGQKRGRGNEMADSLVFSSSGDGELLGDLERDQRERCRISYSLVDIRQGRGS